MSIWINLLNRATHTGTQALATISDAGTAASKDTGTASGEVPELEDVSGSPGLPAVDGSQLTNLPSGGAHVIGSHTDTNLGTPGAGEDTYVIGWDNGNSEYILQEMTGSGGGTITGDLPGVQARRTTTYSLPVTWADLSFDTTDIETSSADLEHTSADQVTLHDTGLYLIQYQYQVTPSINLNNVSAAQGRLRIDDSTVIAGSLAASTVHSDESVPGEDTHYVSGSVLYDCQSADEFVSLQVQHVVGYGAGNAPTINADALLQVIRLGVAAGAGGSSTWIDLTDTDPTTFTGQAGKIVTVNTAEDGLEFTVVGGTGTVTSVAVSGSDGLQVDSGSPITTSGTIALGVDATALRSHINVQDGSTDDQTAGEIEAIVAHDNLLNVNASEHIDWTQDQGATNIEPLNVPEVTAVAAGLAPASGGGTTNYLRADGLWQSPPAAGAEVNDLTSAVTWANVPDANITETSVTQHEAAIDHNALTNTGGNAHIDWELASQGTIHTTNYTVSAADAEQVVIDARSSSGTITDGQAVFITGWDVGSGFITVELAQADSSGTMPSYGIAKSTIGTSTTGQVVVSGELTGIDTTGIEGTSPASAKPVYISAATAGALTVDKPTGANLIQKVGIINRIHGSQGAIQVVGAGRSNDVPNIPDGQAWVGDGSGVATATDFDFTSLGDAPSSYSGLANSLIRVNTGETALEFTPSPVGVTSAGQLSAAQLTSAGNLTIGDTTLIEEVSAPLAPGGIAGQGQIYVKDDAPNKLMFVDDDGTEFDLSDKSYVHTHEGNTIDSTGVNDGYVLTADGADGAAWEVATAGGGITAEEMLPVGDIAIPGTFNNALGSEIYWDGDRVQYVVDPYDAIDWTLTEGSPNDYYVNYAEGDNANAGTSSGAGNSWKTLDYATANATSPAIIHIEDDYIGYLSSGSGVKVFDGKLKLLGEGDFNGTGKSLIVAMRETYSKAGFSWTATGSSNAYKSSTGQAKQYRSQFYLGEVDENGVPRPMTVAADATECENTPGTFFWTGTELYVHMPDGTEPDPFVNWIYTESPFDYEIQQTGTAADDIILLENLDFSNNNGTAVGTGGLRYRPVTTGSETSARLGLKNCSVYGACTMGFQLLDADVIVLAGCASKYNHHDGFNYHSFVTTGTKGEFITVYEHNCKSTLNGYDRWQDQAALGVSNNGSSAHDSMHIIRTNGEHSNTVGATVADVNGTHSLNYAVRAEGPTGAADPKSCFWHETFQAEGTTQIMYLWGCSGNDFGDSSVHLLDNTDTAGGGSNTGEIRVQHWRERTNGTVVGTIFDFDGAATTLEADVRRMAGEVNGPLAAPNDATVLFDGISGTRLKSLKNNFSALTAPALTDDENSGYGVGSTWIDVEAGAHYTLVDPTADAAVWIAAPGGEGTDITLASNALVDVDATEIVIGGAYIDGSTGGTYTWEILSTYADNGGTGNQHLDVYLYDRGPDGTPVAGVLRSTLSNDVVDTFDRVTLTLTASGSPGVDTDTIFNTARMYEVRAKLDAGGGVDTAKVLSCRFTES